MLSRILPPEEYGRLKMTGFPDISKAMQSDDCRILVLEDGEEIVSTMAVVRVVQFESFWINPKYRGNPRVGGIWALAVGCAKAWSARWVAALCDSDRMAKHIRRLGGHPVKAEWFTIPIGD